MRCRLDRLWDLHVLLGPVWLVGSDLRSHTICFLLGRRLGGLFHLDLAGLGVLVCKSISGRINQTPGSCKQG